MTALKDAYPLYYESVSDAEDHFGFSLARLAQLERLLAYLYKTWWKVELAGLDHLPKTGPALVVGNAGGVLPWPALMLMYALMASSDRPRRLHILAEMDWIEDERLHSLLRELGFVPWSSDNARKIFAGGGIAAIFPEGLAGVTKPFNERYRLRDFDWTRILPAVKEAVPIYGMATIGCDESVPVLKNVAGLARFLGLPAFPVTPFFPWLPFPLNMFALPVSWRMRILKANPYEAKTEPDDIEDLARRLSLQIEGNIQAELNRLLRMRVKTWF